MGDDGIQKKQAKRNKKKIQYMEMQITGGWDLIDKIDRKKGEKVDRKSSMVNEK